MGVGLGIGCSALLASLFICLYDLTEDERRNEHASRRPLQFALASILRHSSPNT